MYLLDENHNSIKNLDSYIENQYFWIYNFKDTDFYLKNCTLWQNLKSDAYTLQIGKESITLPFNYYIMIGDYDIGLDFITPEEIVGREFDAFVFSNTFDPQSWELVSMKITGYEHDMSFRVPYVKQPFPVALGERTSILVSNSDMYNKIKDLGFTNVV